MKRGCVETTLLQHSIFTLSRLLIGRCDYLKEIHCEPVHTRKMDESTGTYNLKGVCGAFLNGRGYDGCPTCTRFSVLVTRDGYMYSKRFVLVHVRCAAVASLDPQ